MRQRFRVIAAVAMTLAITFSGIGTAAADPPSESGAVVRFDEPGFTFVRADTHVDGEVRDTLALINFASVADICLGNPAQAGSIQIVDPDDLGPAGFHVSLSDRDVPVQLFDLTDRGVEDDLEFLRLVCAEESLEPFASGSVNIRSQQNINDAQLAVVALFTATGSVSDGDARWRLQVKESFRFSERTGTERFSATIRLS